MNDFNSTPIYIDEYDYLLPDERIAKYPLKKRDSSKLLVYKNDTISTHTFADIARFLPENSLLIYNNTRVIQARLEFFKTTGARIEVFCLEPALPADYAQSLTSNKQCTWKCMVGNLKKWKDGALTKKVNINGRLIEFHAELIECNGNTHTIQFTWNNKEILFADILENAGELPIPPYLHRKTEESDLTNYQTVYSKIKGSVAAPTAGLHFTEDVFDSLKTKHIQTAEVTLHVGAGTFQPVKTRDVAEHEMHTEVIEIHKNTIELLLSNIGNIIAVGTTSVRTLESLYYIGLQLEKSEPNPQHLSQGREEQENRINILHVSQWAPYEANKTITTEVALNNILNYLNKENRTALHAETQIMIKPGYQFKIVKGIITNFHQPKSTLLLLVSAFVNGKWKKIYDYAYKNDYRFLSYGDSSLLFNE